MGDDVTYLIIYNRTYGNILRQTLYKHHLKRTYGKRSSLGTESGPRLRDEQAASRLPDGEGHSP